MSDTYTFEDGTSLRVIGDAILVSPDVPPDKSASGLIHYPGGAMEHVLNTGTILAFGTEKLDTAERVPIRGLEVGLKVCFIRFLAEQESNKQIRARYQGAIRIKKEDVLLVYTADEQDRINR